MMKKIMLCTNHRANPNYPSCAARGSKQILDALQQTLKDKSMLVGVEESPCMGLCEVGPNGKLVPNGKFLNHLSIENLPQLVEEIVYFSTHK